ncbi:MAG TPA: phosphoribosylaminoimidazolesuccinocarboxamide synthase, partial [Thermoanaerobaculia bacterium]|nr:phosphoribosylaminoimidazolesuccinocarboxamide synthase [Thermoanaerobaculia bacterium]
LHRRGKVRDVYGLGERLLVVATDRLSAFDVVLPTGIPGKGVLLTQMSLFWFRLLADVVPNHVVTADVSEYPVELRRFRDQLEGRSMIVLRTDVLPVECVVRGYITGSGWKDYKATGSVCGIALRRGLRESDRLDPPIFTPATKAETGHDENIPYERMVETVGEERAAEARRVSLEIYARARAHAEARGILLADMIPNHVVTADVGDYPPGLRPFREQLEGRSMIVLKTDVLPVECVVRGYITGSGWKDYKATGSVCGIALPAGLRESDRVDPPVFTPATKAETGHDENISYETMARTVGEERAAEARRVSLEIYARARAHAEARGILLADTKFEFGVRDGRLVWVDEALTPDSSRFWPREGYAPGRPQPSFDKQFVRDYLETLRWDKTPPGPTLPPDVVARTVDKYVEAFERLRGEAR